MKTFFTLTLTFLALGLVNAQAPITSIVKQTITAGSSFTYTDAGKTYNWGVSPNNTVDQVKTFSSGGLNYGYAQALNGVVKLRRVDNANITGNFTLVWAKTLNSGNVYNMFPEYQNEMETFFNNNIIHKGTDNLFQNAGGTNLNNIERLDWILSAGYATSQPGKIGYAVFERGLTGAHDAFCIAAITALDGSGNPSAYGPIVRVKAADYGDVTSNFDFNVLKAPYPSNLIFNTNITQLIGGCYISLSSLGIAANQTVYGYSLFADDLPLSATPANLVDYTNSTYFPTNTGNEGGIDLAAITGIFIESSILPVRFTEFIATENNGSVALKWSAENENLADRYLVERSTDGVHFSPLATVKAAKSVAGSSSYNMSDNISGLGSNQFFYRIKQYDMDGSYHLSNTLLVRNHSKNSGMALYPNPVQDNLFLMINSGQSKEVKVIITNAYGQQVLTDVLRLSAGNNSVSIKTVDRLPAGTYQLSVMEKEGSKQVRQFIKK